MKTKPGRFSKVLFVISCVLMTACVAYFLIGLLDVVFSSNGGESEEAGKAIGLAVFLTLLLMFGSIAFGICTILNIVCFSTHRNVMDYPKKKKWNVIFFIFIFVPFLLEGILFLVFRLMV